MKNIIRLAIMFVLLGVFVKGYSAAVIGSDVYFTTSFAYDAQNAANPGGTDNWMGKSTMLYLGLYPILRSGAIRGDAKIFVNSEDFNNIYFGGVKVTGTTADKMFEATAFAMAPALGMSDPMATGSMYGGYIYTSAAARGVRFSDAKNTVKYPAIFDEKDFAENNYELGGRHGVGVQTKATFAQEYITLENFIAWSLDNYDVFGALLKMNPLELGVISLEVGATAELLKYKASQNFNAINAYNLFDFTKLLPNQSPLASFKEDRFTGLGGFFRVGILEMLDVFGQIKFTATSAAFDNTDRYNSIDGMRIYAGVISDFIDGTITEVNFAMISEAANTNTAAGLEPERNGMQIGLKAYGGLDFDIFGMVLYYLADVSYFMMNDTTRGFNRTEFGAMGATFTNANGLDLKASAKFDFFFMFSFRELLRFNMLNFENAAGNTYAVTQFESRSYFDIDLEDLMDGLWATVGIRLVSLSVEANIDTTTGSDFYVLPYAEIKYLFGEYSFLRLSWGIGEIQSVLAEAYGLGYDNIIKQSSIALDDDNNFYHNGYFGMQNNHSINLEVGLRL
jgi:hypothetical protein